MAKSNSIDDMIFELYTRLGAFSRKETFIGYTKLSITKDLFETELEYIEFYDLLAKFHDAMTDAEHKTYSQEIKDNLLNSFKALMEKYPNQTDRFILENIYDTKESKYVPQLLSYISKKDIVSTKLNTLTIPEDDSFCYTMGVLSSTTIRRYLDTSKLSRDEQTFLDNFLSTENGNKFFKVIKPEDIARCVNDVRMASAIYFSISSIFDNIKEDDKRSDFIMQYVSGEIRNLNLDRLKLIMYYRYFEHMNETGAFSTANIQELESIRNSFYKDLAGTYLSMDSAEIIIPESDKTSLKIDLISGVTGRTMPITVLKREKKQADVLIQPTETIPEKLNFQSLQPSLGLDVRTQESMKNMIDDFPIFILSDDSTYHTKTVTFPDEGTISKKALMKKIDDLLLELKFDQIIEISLDDIQKQDGNTSFTQIDEQKQKKYKYSSISECLKGIVLTKENLEIFTGRILERVRFENIECDSKEIAEKLKEQKRLIFTYLIKQKIFNLSNAIDFDFEILCECLRNGEIEITTEDFLKTRLSPENKEAIFNIALSNTQLLENLINSNTITRNDLLNLNLASYTELTQILFSRNIININDLAKLIKDGKITLKDIENFDLDNISISNDEIVSKYSEIYSKKAEYEKAAKTNYEKAIEDGIDESEVTESEEEKVLREELQELTLLKNIYITLFKKQKMSNLEEYHRRQDIYMDVIERCYADDDFENSIITITNMLYEDNFISMAQVQQFDDSLFIPILKSGKAKKEDINRFKSEIVSPDEIDKLRQELSEQYSGDELEEELRKQVYVNTYKKLYALMEKILLDESSSKEEKLSILYSIFSKNTVTEKTHRDFFEAEILVKIYGKLKYKRKSPLVDPNDEKMQDEDEIIPEESNQESKSTYKQFVYPTTIIWNFIELLDPEYKFRILSDGYVVFESEKLNKAFIENVWQTGKDGDFIRRGYGSTTLILDFDTYKLNESELIRLGRHGYKMDVLKAKSYLPTIQTPKGDRQTGMIIHEKDLKNTGKKIWFELILEHLGISQSNIDSKKCNYTQEDLDKINKFILESKYKYEEMSK